MTIKAIRGQMFAYVDDPFINNNDEAYKLYNDGLMLIENGKIKAIGEYQNLCQSLTDDIELTHYQGRYVIMPGFLDTHVHYSQIPMIGAYGKHLIDWLNNYTFVFEQTLEAKEVSVNVARNFLRESIRNGVTTSFVYATVYKSSVDSLFAEAAKINMRIGTGKVLMDRNAPEHLTDTPEKGYKESEELIQKWHGKHRSMYVVTPRFAPTSSPEQLQAAGDLWKKYQGTYMQTHLCETVDEIEWVKSLYPQRNGYLDVYHHYGLTGKRAIFGHCIHLNDQEWQLMADTDSSVSHCPTSNMFLGSGLFDIRKAYRNKDNPVRVGLGSDLGAGTSYSPLQTLNEAYKVALLNNCSWLDSYHAFYLATRGSAKSAHLEDTIGSLQVGLEADFIVLDLESTPFLKFRNQYAKDLKEALFVQMICGDDRAIHATYIDGDCVYKIDEQYPKGVFLNRAAFLNEINHQTEIV